MFVLIFHLWENFCHRQFKGHAANIMSICRYSGIYDFIELGQKVCGGSPGSGRGEGDRFALGGGKKKSGLIFVSNAFPSTYGPCFLAYIAPNLAADP